VEDFANVEGLGVQGIVDGHAVLVGHTWLLEEWSQHLPVELERAKAAAEAEGKTAVAVGWDGRARAILTVADTIKDTSAEAIGELTSLGLRPILLTGDNESVARTITAEAGIEEVIAEVLPADKVDVIKRLQPEGRTVAMAGDGVHRYNQTARPFRWKFTRNDLDDMLARIERHEQEEPRPQPAHNPQPIAA
jgi:Cu+-exporting ATPase